MQKYSVAPRLIIFLWSPTSSRDSFFPHFLHTGGSTEGILNIINSMNKTAVIQSHPNRRMGFFRVTLFC